MDADRLRAVPLFADVPEPELMSISQDVETLKVGPGKVLTAQDEYAFKFFVIVDGHVSVWQQGKRIRRLGPGEHFGEVGLIDAAKRTATVTTDTDTELAVFMEWDLHRIEKEAPTIFEKITRAARARLADDVDRL